jgi:hypothetical protein
MSGDLTVYEGDNSKADFTLTYGPTWSDTTKRGTPVPKSDTTRVFFYVKKLVSDTSAWLTLNDNGQGITWLDTANGKIRVTFGTGTSGRAGDGQTWELRIKLSDGTYISVDRGTFNVIDSLIDLA